MAEKIKQYEPTINRFCTAFACTTVDQLPAEAKTILEFTLIDKIGLDVLKDLAIYLADMKYLDANNISLLDKTNLLKALRFMLSSKSMAKLIWKDYSKIFKPQLDIERQLYLDLAELNNFTRTKKDKFRLPLLRKYSPIKDMLANPLRADFEKSLKAEEFNNCKKIMFQLNFRKVAVNKMFNKDELMALKDRLMAKVISENLEPDAISKMLNSEIK